MKSPALVSAQTAQSDIKEDKQGGEEPAEPPGRSTSSTCLERGMEPSQVLFPLELPLDDPRAFGATREQWDDWRWQMRRRIRSIQQLEKFLPSVAGMSETAGVTLTFPMAITPYYASLIRKPDFSDPVFSMCVPNARELLDAPSLVDDPLEEAMDSPVPNLVHRYPDRALFITTTTCASYCRHCTRKRMAGAREGVVSLKRVQKTVEYLCAHPEISDVVVSGGDPLTMATEILDGILAELRKVPSVQVIRIGTRTPVVLPQRITAELTDMLRKHHPLWINTHFNHPQELTPESARACAMLADAGIPLGNQSVLLRGINDDPKTMVELCRGLVRMRVRPYYLYQCDLVRGVEHFRTPISRGIEIMEYMRGRLSGIAIPTFIVDAPHGGGKIPVLPTYVVSQSPTHTVLRNFEGMLVNYPEPHAMRVESCEDTAPGVWELATGKASAIIPQRTNRHKRRAGHEPVDPRFCE